jgi:hypothetical protein
MTMKKGDRIRSNLTDKVYKVKIIKDRMVVLESEDGSNQVLTEKENLKLFYEKVENENRPRDLTLHLLSTLPHTNVN